VDGKPVDSQLEQRAFLKAEGKPEVEITERLKSLGVPLVPTSEAAGAALSALSEPQRKALEDAAIMYAPPEFDTPKGPHTDPPEPRWTLRSKFWRRQVFPAGKDILVEQTYTPAVGGSVSMGFGTENGVHYRETYCTDGPFTRAAESLRKVRPSEFYLSYVITSGANWAGPIGTFRLVVDKGDSGTLVSFCGDGVKKIGPTTFEMIAKDYTPKRDIDVLFIENLRNR
jgi:hypothetical protein